MTTIAGIVAAMRRLGCFVFALACACSKTSEPATNPDPDAGADAAAPLYHTALFDCTSLSKPPLPRRAASTPECLRDPKCKTRLVVGHRGAGGQLGRIAPEDTLAAYRAAVALGFDIVETDPRPTKDGVIVNMHDDTVDRTTNGTGDVASMTFDELRKLKIRTDLPGDYSCEKVPTLRELLEVCRDRALVLVDANKTDRVDLLVQAIKDADALDWAVFDTSDLTKIDAALAIEPRLMIQPRIHDEKQAQAIIDKYKTTHPPVFIEIAQDIFPRTADLVHASGTRTMTDVFVIDLAVKLGEPNSRYLEFFDKGADVLQTDLPDEVAKALGRRVPPQ
jgi:glycerophosphoryl diester phosphodiesterase